MGDPITDPKQAGERLLAFAREGRLVQGTWHAVQNGREVACLLGAAVGINDASECPASLMPHWMAWALPGLYDGQTKAHSHTFAHRWGEAMIRPEWSRIDWVTVRNDWMAFVIKQALDAAFSAAPYAAYATSFATDAVAAARDAASANSANSAASAAARTVYAAATDATDAARTAARDAARDAQADALMAAIERAMEVARG